MAILAAGRNMAPPGMLVKLILLAIGAVFALLLGEAVLRMVGLGHPHHSVPELYQPNSDPRVLFELRPGFDGFSEGAPVKTNTQGLRERELSLDKPPDVIRVLFLGDSVTFGAGVRAEQAFPRLLEGHLGDGVQTVNAGVVGYNTTQELARLEAVGLAYEPDAVVLTFLVNDLLDSFSIFDHQYDPRGLFAAEKVWLRRHSHLYRFVQNSYWRLAQERRRASAGPSENVRPRARLEERLTEIAAIERTARASGAAFLLVLYPDNLDDPVSAGPSGERVSVREELGRFAAATDLTLVDLTASIGNVRDPRAREMRLREDPHPSPAGHRAIADALTPSLRKLLRP